MEVALGATNMTRPTTADELCQLHAPMVCRFADVATHNAADAEHLAQEALLQAVRSLSSYDSARGFQVLFVT